MDPSMQQAVREAETASAAPSAATMAEEAVEGFDTSHVARCANCSYLYHFR